MKKYICLLMLGTIFQATGMRPFPKDSDVQLEEATRDLDNPKNVELAIQALKNRARPNVKVQGQPILHYIVEQYKQAHLRPLFDALIKAKAAVTFDNGFGMVSVFALATLKIQSDPSNENLKHYIESVLKVGGQVMDGNDYALLYSIILKPCHDDAACAQTNNTILQQMIAVGAPIDILDPRYGTPVRWAAFQGNRDAFKILIAAGFTGESDEKQLIDFTLKKCSILKKRDALVAVLQGKGREKQTAPVCAVPARLLCRIAEYLAPTI